MTERKSRIWIAAIVAIALIATGWLAIDGQVKAANYHQQITNNYQYSFAELTAAAGELDTALQKCLYATTPELFSTLCTQAFSKAQAAQSAVGQLPYSNVELEKTSSFLAKTGDYLMSLSRNAVKNNGCTEEDRKLLESLSATATTLANTLRDLQTELYAGNLSLDDISVVEKRLAAVTEQGEQVTSAMSFQTLEADFPEMPTLIYDGPFSDHITSRSPRMLEGQKEVSEEEAQKLAADFLGLTTSELLLTDQGGETIATYDFTASAPDNGTYYIEVTRQGGRIFSVLNSAVVGQSTLTQEQAEKAALEFLQRNGYDNLTATYFIQQNNVLTINFAAMQDDVICYPDLIKIAVSMHDGHLMGYETHGYLNNHYERTIAQDIVGEDAARAVVSSNLEILSHRMAIIPTDGQYEVYCHEFKCSRADGTHVIVYVNAETGLEERILLLLEDESGTLAM